ncbi:MAG: hypothetical protein IPI67_31440 [Myxococcales bacterium]|nr:hypothetical protein [Myxococcales bacterium]
MTGDQELAEALTRALSIESLEDAAEQSALEARLREGLEQARSKCPGARLSVESWLAHVASKLDPGIGLMHTLEGVHLDELYVVAGCLSGDRKSLELFEQLYGGVVSSTVAKLRIDADARDEVTQEVMSGLLVPRSGEPAKLQNYSGRGSLGSYLKVIATRTALRRKRRRRPEGPPADSLLIEGYFLTLFGLAEEGESELRRALDVVQRLGLSELEQMMQQNLGFALLRLGRRAEAEECYAKSLAALGESGAQRKQGISHLYLAQIALERGEHACAELAARQSVECFEAGAPHLVPFARAVTARALMESGQTEPALWEADAAYAHLSEKTGVAEGEFYVRWTKADLVSRSGDRAEALRIVDLAAARLRELAARIQSPELRTSFLERVPVHALVFSLREQWHADGHGESSR